MVAAMGKAGKKAKVVTDITAQCARVGGVRPRGRVGVSAALSVVEV